ncbi:G/T mismatch-specific thymine DNA glycosylase-like [Oppia nitens]|uniref:G/T mismatch-specific thymine DNA glycosylase-like n=1 Tax=Oppia nitens TaxID=1686743 RepID=UPI0023DA83D4|nr:G/T mismatch-specific thymine DNA glycosylase-like [Oppia nitens]
MSGHVMSDNCCQHHRHHHNLTTDDDNRKKQQQQLVVIDGLSECQLQQRTLPDHLAESMDLLIVGINPGYASAARGHHYAGRGNHFWKCLHLSGLVDKPMTATDDYRLIGLNDEETNGNYRIGFTNIVSRTTRGSDCLSKQEIKTGGQVLRNKILRFKPTIAVFNGKGIYQIFSGTTDFKLGLQPNSQSIGSTLVYVMPSSSARCSQWPRITDKLPFYISLREILDKIHTLNAANTLICDHQWVSLL